METQFKIGDRVVNLPAKLLPLYRKWDIDHNVHGATIIGFILGKNNVPYIVKVKVDGKRKGYEKEGWSIDNISLEQPWRDKANETAM